MNEDKIMITKSVRGSPSTRALVEGSDVEAIEVLDLNKLDKSYVCVVNLLTDGNYSLRQVTLRRDKVSNNLIRLGESESDECPACWYHWSDIQILSVLGKAKENKKCQIVPVNAANKP